MRNVKILATSLRIFAVIYIFSSLYMYGGDIFYVPTDQKSWLAKVVWSASRIAYSLMYPVLVFTAAYLLEFLQEFRQRVLEQLEPTNGES